MSALPQGIAAAQWLIDQGLTLIPLQPKSKIPAGNAWSTDVNGWLATQTALAEHYLAEPNAGYSILHAPSHTAALDIDHVEYATIALAAIGIDLPGLLDQPGVKIVTSHGPKPIYRLPASQQLSRVCLTWPPQSPDARDTVALELRAGRHHDAVPPTIHPITGQPYILVGDPVIPEIPPELLELWLHWGDYRRAMLDACPWRPQSTGRSLRPAQTPDMYCAEGASVIDRYNKRNPIGDVLERYGYLPARQGRWLYPGSHSGTAGVVLLPQPGPREQQVIWSHHAGDPLADHLWDAAGIELLLAHGINTYTSPRDVIAQGIRLLGGDTAMGQPQSETHWPDLRLLPPAESALPTMTPDLLPNSLRSWLAAEAHGAGVPLEMLAIPIVYCAGAIVGTRLTIRNSINAPAVPGNLWALTCSPPGTRKSYALDLGIMALRELQEASDQRAAIDRSQREANRDVAAAQLTTLLEGLKAKNEADVPTTDRIAAARQALAEADAALVNPSYLTSDATIEAIGGLLQHNPNGIAIVRDELPGWLASFERAGREQDRAFFLEAANGTNTYTINRVQRGKLHIPRLSLSVIGNIQPQGLTKLVSSQAGAGDGLLQRFQLFIWCNDLPAYDQEALRRPISAHLRQHGTLSLKRLADLTAENMGCVDDVGHPMPLQYSIDAQTTYDQWEARNAHEIRDTAFGEAYRAHIAKQPSTFARIAMIMHCLNVVGDGAHPQAYEVSAQAAELAARWCDYLAAHARKLWGEGAKQDVLDAQHIYQLIERGRVKPGKQADLAKYLRESGSEIRSDRLQAALAVLADCNVIRIDKGQSGKSGGRPTAYIRIHPDLM
ncbi:DUF3987 domain-containing protein [Deinococcus sp. PESE-13]